MKQTKIVFGFGLVVILLFSFAFAERIERTASTIMGDNPQPTKNSPVPAELSTEVKSIPANIQSPANYILVTDELDGFGGQKYDDGCNLSIFAGGQSSPIGAGSSTNYKLYAGFVYPSVVLCGDVNGSGVVELGDIVYLITYLYKSGPVPGIYQSADVNCSGLVELGDVVYLISYLYKSGPEPIC